MPLLHTFLDGPPTKTIVSANGHHLLFSDSSELYDFSCGITGHSIIGWGVKSVSDAIAKQSSIIGHIDYKSYLDPNREKLALLLENLTTSKLKYTFFVGGSGEACEASIKLSYQAHCNNDKPEKIYYISRKQAYHGMSSDNLSLGDRPNLALYNRFHPQNRLHAPEHNYFRHAHKDESPSEYGSRSVQELRSFLLKNDISKIGGLVIETMMGGLVGDVPPSQLSYWRKKSL